MEEMSRASEDLSERETCARQPESEVFIKARSRDIAKLRTDLDGFHPLAGEPVERGRTSSPGGTSSASPFGGGDQNDDSVSCLAISATGDETGNAAV